jgi:hypothetical protein
MAWIRWCRVQLSFGTSRTTRAELLGQGEALKNIPAIIEGVIASGELSQGIPGAVVT